MHENAPVLQATSRPKIGSRYAKRMRDGGKLPAILYGHGQQPLPILLETKATLEHIHKGEKVYTLKIEGQAKDQTVLLKDVQFDYLGTRIIHADFARVDLTERVRTRVHVRFVGEAIGLKTVGAVLIHPTTELEIECMVSELPEHIDLDITGLEVGAEITAGQVKLPTASMKLLTDSHASVAHIVLQKEEVVAPTAEAGAATAAAQPEVLTAKKPGEGDAAKGAAKPAPKK
ncbi:MAG: 50S ribosomal protein L25 [Phycisphaeraceae bacterium]|nr:50S ribosomal protein L25 [Phycisphaeraceae bacterium]